MALPFKKRVLIVEDDQEIRNSFSLIVNSSQKISGDKIAMKSEPDALRSLQGKTHWMRYYISGEPFEDPDTKANVFFLGDAADNPYYSARYNGLRSELNRIAASLNAGFYQRD